MNWLDLGIIIGIIIYVYLGLKKGLMTSVLSNFTFGLNALISFFLYKPVLKVLNWCFGMESAIFNSYSADLINHSANFSVNLLEVSKESLSPFVRLTLSEGQIPLIPRLMFNFIVNKPSLYDKLHNSGHTSRTMADIVAGSYATFFSTVISFIVSMALIYLVVFLLKKLVEKLRTNGFVKVVDNMLGAIYAIGRFMLTLIIICLVLKLLTPIPIVTTITNYISKSFFGKLIYRQVDTFLDNFLNYQEIINSLFK